MEIRLEPTILISGDPSFVVGRLGGAGLLCHLYRVDPSEGYDREVGITAHPVRLDASGQADVVGTPPLDLRIGIDCGYIYHGDGRLADASDAPGLADLQAALEGKVLNALAERWLSERGQRSKAGQRRIEMDHLDDWQPGEPLSWESVFEVLREENIHGPRGCYAVFDLYFVEPKYDRHEVIVHFAEGPHGPTREVGGVRLDLTRGNTKLLPKRGQSALLKHLWTQYRQRYRDFSHLEARWAEMQEFGIEFSRRVT